MSVGCTTISTPAGGVPEIISNGTTGFISQSFTVNDFYNTIIKALDTSQNINPAIIIEQYNNHHTMQKCAKKYQELYNGFLY